MRFSATAERILVGAVLAVGVALAAAIVIVTVRTQGVERRVTPATQATSAAKVSTRPHNPLLGLRRLAGKTRFWLDYLAFDGTSLPIGQKVFVPTIAAGVPFTISGWAVDTSAKKPAAAVFAQLDDATPAVMIYGKRRPDVARFFHMPAYQLVGFSGPIPTANLPAGIHTIYLNIIDHAG
ncbi:MAG: hypothetical protein JOZ22_15520, partial [Acidobacteriia bacterium]|nr:hypothetical protein [Terriglobia bacterium]